MPAASCPHCDEQVMPYLRYAIHMKRAASCRACGRNVRVRGYVTAMVVGLAIAGLLVAFMVVRAPDLVPAIVVTVGLGLLAVAADYSFWRWVGFEAAPDAAAPAMHTALADSAGARQDTLSSS